MQQKRLRILTEGVPSRGAVVYWMSRDQRVQDNWALLFAQEVELKYKDQLVVVFCVVPRFLEATERK